MKLLNVPKVKLRPIFFIFVIVSWGGYYLSPFILDKIPPMLKIDGITDGEIYQNQISIEIESTDQQHHRSSGLKSVFVQIDDDPPILIKRERVRSYPFTLDTTNLSDREHKISIFAIDKSLNRNENRSEINFSVDNNPPEIELGPEKLIVGQGRTFAIFVKSNEKSEIRGEIFNKTVKFYPIENGVYRVLTGVGVKQDPGIYPIKISATDQLRHTTTKSYFAKVIETEFERGGYIKLSQKKQKIMRDREKSREDNAKRAKAYSAADRTEDQFWKGEFLRPASGTLTSPFGKFREYNTGVKRHHLGTDIANRIGTAIYASNGGIVTLADRLHIYGNCVVINHGQGVSTSYNHLNEIRVKVGDRVKKDQEIGLMGATGQVTGSHLHWGMVVNGVAVAPEEWIENDFSSAN